MMRSNLRRRLMKHKPLLIGLVFLFCLLLTLGYGYMTETYKDAAHVLRDKPRGEMAEGGKSRPVSDTFLSSRDKAPIKLILSARNYYSGKPLEDPFMPLSDDKVIAKDKDKDKYKDRDHNLYGSSNERALKGKPLGGNSISSDGGPHEKSKTGHGASSHYQHQWMVKGVIWGARPKAIISDGQESSSYGVGEGPPGYKVLTIEPHRVVIEGGIEWEY